MTQNPHSLNVDRDVLKPLEKRRGAATKKSHSPHNHCSYGIWFAHPLCLTYRYALMSGPFCLPFTLSAEVGAWCLNIDFPPTCAQKIRNYSLTAPTVIWGNRWWTCRAAIASFLAPPLCSVQKQLSVYSDAFQVTSHKVAIAEEDFTVHC